MTDYKIQATGGKINPLGCALAGDHEYDVIYTFKMNAFKGYMENTITYDEMNSSAGIWYNISACLRCKEVTGLSRSSRRVPNIVCLISNDNFSDNSSLADPLAFLLLYFTEKDEPQYWDGEKYVLERPKNWAYGSVTYKNITY